MRLPDTLPRLVGDRVVLREFQPRDVPLVVLAGTDPLIPLITTVPAHGNDAEALAFVERQRGRLAEGAGCSFAIEDVTTHEAVGQIGLWTREIVEGRATIGYWVSPGHRRRGHLTDALRTLTGWAEGIDEMHRLQLYVEPWNEGSWRAAVACGYGCEGVARSWQTVGEGRKDMAVYARVRQSGGWVPSGPGGG